MGAGALSIILEWVLFGSYGLSGLITFLNNSSSNNRIRRKGYNIKPITENSLIENIKYGIKDFGFLIVPVYNVIKSIKQMVQKDSEFDSEKIARLSDRDRLEEVKKEEVKPKKAKEETKKVEEVKKEHTSSDPKKVSKKVKTVEEMTCYEKADFYKNEYNRVLALRNKAKSEGKDVSVLNKYTHQLRYIVEEYQKAQRECAIEDLKTERNIILSQHEGSRSLIRR